MLPLDASSPESVIEISLLLKGGSLLSAIFYLLIEKVNVLSSQSMRTRKEIFANTIKIVEV